MGADARRVDRHQHLDHLPLVWSWVKAFLHSKENLGVGAVQRPTVMPFPHRLPRPELRRQIPPRRTHPVPPGDPFQDHPVIRPSLTPPSYIRGQLGLDHSPQLIGQHPSARHAKIITDIGRQFGRHALVEWPLRACFRGDLLMAESRI